MSLPEFVPDSRLDQSSQNGPEADQFEYGLLVGHKRNDGTYKTGEQLRMEYIQLTDGIVKLMTEGTQFTDPATGERRIERPDIVIWLDKSARPLSWFTKALWPRLAPKPGSTEVPTMPDSKFLNIDRDQWINAVDPQGVGIADVNRIDQSIIRSLRSVFISPNHKRQGLTPAIDAAPTLLDGKRVLVVDEVRSTGRTLEIALAMLERAFPSAAFAGTHWMSYITMAKGSEAVGNLDLPVWYKSDRESGRGIGNRDSAISARSANLTQRLGAWFLSTRLSKPDESALQLRHELQHLALHPDVPVLPDFSRPDRNERMVALNGGQAFEVVKAAMRRIKGME